MKNYTKLLLSILITSQLLLSASQGTPMEYLGTRKAGMGGAATAISSDRESMFYNPAMLFYTKNGVSLPLLNNAFILNDGLGSAMSNLTGDSDSNSEGINNISKLIPLELGFGYNTNMSLVFDFPFKSLADKFAISGYAFTKLSGEIRNPISPVIRIQGSSDIVLPAISFSKSLKTGNDFFIDDVITGFTIKRINRISLYNEDSGDESIEIPVLAIIEGNDNYAYQDANGYGFDLGITGKLPSTNINVALAINNLSTSLTGKRYVIRTTSVNTETEVYNFIQNIPTIAKAGISFENDWLSKFIPFIGYQIKDKTLSQENSEEEEFVISSNNEQVSTNNNEEKTIEVVSTVENEEITVTTDQQITSGNNKEPNYAKTVYALDFDIITPYTSLFKRLHMGLDQPVLPFLNVRLGINQGYGTFGIKFNIFDKFHCGYTYYTEELGEEIGINPASYHIYDFGFYW